ncbi:WhiB family transcriptional regulator [Saccharothrix sp. SC076]|nr:WhiB family transcriptional regulator [Saccharothrix obliqua]
MWALADSPPWAGADMTDRELAARMCSGCPVRAECLEVELRTAGATTLGVWGGLSADDRRALYLLWAQRGDRGPRS